ncbi:hypothetical protein F6X50_02030 [Dickeya dianthicola]|uniref:hypothetical protein n=1 Tax=Dickeya dianthicola TaxID=204039 RepID=UPI00136F96A8|nr:hypothetical protein [Dickeya dianthicola]MBT1427773.1 hypothetical protein [Dickeya dianthicola]MBT1459286.1 hypothetical protein [Dickeya dianthicola]MBT1488483.1 hypothetical protein [Dickeya dianthicola]MCI4235632.1 hypothetical protein [Dickeya dianthicola]MCI4255782.1 hypothetical protein [Dickeya dianthicola]
MNKPQTPLLALALSLLSLAASAADGYKNLKFGASAAAIRQQANCSLRGPEMIMGQTVYICPDFGFADKKTQAIFSFNSDKFNRLAISIALADVPSVVEGLKNKYGMTTPLSANDVDTFMNKPNTRVTARFDKNNITLVFDNSIDNQKSIYLVYNAENSVSAGPTAAPANRGITKDDL